MNAPLPVPGSNQMDAGHQQHMNQQPQEQNVVCYLFNDDVFQVGEVGELDVLCLCLVVCCAGMCMYCVCV